MKTLTTLTLTAQLLVPLAALYAADAPKPVKPNEERQTHYQPTRESLSQHCVPEWYQDAKIGFFYHWGPQSVVGDKFDKDALEFCRAQGKYAGAHLHNPPGQWGATMYPRPGKPEKEQNGVYSLHRKWYGDPKEFGYKDFIPLLTGENFDPEGMVKLLDEAGVKYIAPMAVHHDGFAMWDSKVKDQKQELANDLSNCRLWNCESNKGDSPGFSSSSELHGLPSLGVRARETARA